MNTTLLQRYEDTTSLVHQLDARLKLVTALSLIVGVLLTPAHAWLAYPLMWILLANLAVLSHIKVWRLSRLATVALPFALASITLLFTTPGQSIITLGNLSITDAGTARFVAIILKSWLAMQIALLLTMTTRFTNILWALEQLRMPKTLVAIVGFLYRYLFTIKDEAERLLRARAARSGQAVGYHAGGNILWRAKVVGSMVGNLFLRSYERSERVYAAMLARGYNGETLRQDKKQLKRSAIIQSAIPIIIMVILQVLVRL